jgi:hypothetical protein
MEYLFKPIQFLILSLVIVGIDGMKHIYKQDDTSDLFGNSFDGMNYYMKGGEILFHSGWGEIPVDEMNRKNIWFSPDPYDSLTAILQDTEHHTSSWLKGSTKIKINIYEVVKMPILIPLKGTATKIYNKLNKFASLGPFFGFEEGYYLLGDKSSDTNPGISKLCDLNSFNGWRAPYDQDEFMICGKNTKDKNLKQVGVLVCDKKLINGEIETGLVNKQSVKKLNQQLRKLEKHITMGYFKWDNNDWVQCYIKSDCEMFKFRFNENYLSDILSKCKLDNYINQEKKVQIKPYMNIKDFE